MLKREQIEAVHAYDVIVGGHAFQVANEGAVSELKHLALIGLAVVESGVTARELGELCAFLDPNGIEGESDVKSVQMLDALAKVLEADHG